MMMSVVVILPTLLEWNYQGIDRLIYEYTFGLSIGGLEDVKIKVALKPSLT